MSLMEDSDIVKFHIKKALCIKNGFMTQGRQFCIKNKVYEYIITGGTHKYSVKSETSFSCNHSMTADFFKKYYLPDWEPTKYIPLEDDLFEI